MWYRTAGLGSRNQKDLAVEIIEAEIRSALYEVWLEAAKMVLTDAEPGRDRAEAARDGRAGDPADRTMRFVIAAMRNRTFLCAAIIVNAVLVMVADWERIKWELWDICEVLLVLLVIAYLRVAEPDEEFLGLIRGMLFGLVGMTVVAHIFN